MKKFLAALVLALALPVHAANPFGTDFSDLWFNPAESGWGVNLNHQMDVIFATLFVYGPDGKAKWYVASDLRHEAEAPAHTPG